MNWSGVTFGFVCATAVLMFGAIYNALLTIRTAVRDVAAELRKARLKSPCPHGYQEGDHHWYGCMNVNPFSDSTPPGGTSTRGKRL